MEFDRIAKEYSGSTLTLMLILHPILYNIYPIPYPKPIPYPRSRSIINGYDESARYVMDRLAQYPEVEYC